MLTFRALQLDTGAEVCLDLVRGFFEPAEVRGRDWTAYGIPGQTPGNRRDHERELLLEGYIRGLGVTPEERRESFYDATRAVMDVMDRHLDPGPLVASSGYLGLPTGSEATIDARCVSISTRKMESYNLYPIQLWSIELLSVDPNWVLGS